MKPANSSSELFTHAKRESELDIAPGIRGYERHEVIFPYRNRANENANRALQKNLCRDPVFQAQLQELRTRIQQIPHKRKQSFGDWLQWLSEQDQEIFSRLREHTKWISAYWGFDGWEWIAWLARDWDPGKEEFPPLEPGEALPFIGPWIVEPFKHKLQADSSNWQTKYVRLTFWPGISQKQAARALEQALKNLPSHKAQGRPSVSDKERRVLQGLFGRLPLLRKPTRGDDTRAIALVMESLKQLYKKEGMAHLPGSLQDINVSTVTKEYYSWKSKGKKESKKKRSYLTQAIDRRTDSDLSI